MENSMGKHGTAWEIGLIKIKFCKILVRPPRVFTIKLHCFEIFYLSLLIIEDIYFLALLKTRNGPKFHNFFHWEKNSWETIVRRAF